MPEDKQVEEAEVQTEQEQEDAALSHMEDTLKEMHGDDSYDDIDQETDVTDDQENEENEETQGADQSIEDDQAQGDEESGSEGKAKAKPEDVSGEEDSDLQDTEADPEDASEVEDDKLMDGMKESTAKRFQHFRDENTRLSGEVEQSQANYQELHKSTEAMNFYIEDSKINPEQLSTALSMAKAINTGDFETARAVFPRMQAWMNEVAVGLGDDSAKVTLPEHLQTAQDNLDISPELAQQQAVLYAQQQRQQNYRNQGIQQQQQQQQVQHNAQNAAGAIKSWEDGLVMSDPDFSAKRKQMLKSSEAIMQSYPPDQWLYQLQNQYGIISETMQTISAEQTRKSAMNQGIRPGATSGSAAGHESEPSNLDELIKRDLAKMRGQA